MKLHNFSHQCIDRSWSVRLVGYVGYGAWRFIPLIYVDGLQRLQRFWPAWVLRMPSQHPPETMVSGNLDIWEALRRWILGGRDYLEIFSVLIGPLYWQSMAGPCESRFVAKAHVLQRVHTAGGALLPGDGLKSGLPGERGWWWEDVDMIIVLFWLLFFHILGISSHQLTFIFFRGVKTTNQYSMV